MKRADEPDLSEWVRKAQAGDEAAFEFLIERTQRRLFRFCFHLTGQRQQAEDLCQESLIRALDQIQTLKDPASFYSWLFTMAKNHFIDWNRRPASQERTYGDDEPATIDASAPNHEDLIAVQRILSALSPDERMVLVLVDMEEYTYAEAAEIIGISENALRSRVHRARNAFLKLFNKE